MSATEKAFNALDSIVLRLLPEFKPVADAIWDYAELGFEEHRSAQAQMSLLAQKGFAIEKGLAGLDTAFSASWGETGPVIGFLGEFDALPGLSQVAGVTAPKPVVDGGPGHGCGHNLLGTGSMLAAASLAAYLAETGKPGIVRYFACPAEEGGFGKGLMVKAGVFDEIDVAIGWHPGTFNGVRARSTLAVMNRAYAFTGRAAHAAMAPHKGRSALDAVELMSVGVNYMREHMPDDARVHYAVTDAGGEAPGVVQARAAVRYMIRAREMADVQDLVARVDDIARGAALMSGTSVEISSEGGASNVIPNRILCQGMHDVMAALGPLPFSDDETGFAAKIVQTLPGTAGHDKAPADLFPDQAQTPLHSGLRNFDGAMGLSFGSTDVGDVSWIVPTVECATATWAAGTPSHSWQVVTQGKTGAAHRAMARAASVMAGTGLMLVDDPARLERARAEHADRLDGRPYSSPFASSPNGSASR